MATKSRRAAIVTTLVCLVGLLPAISRATYPGENGMIAFTNSHTEDIFLMNADGSLPGPFLADPQLYEDDPSWSADGSQLTFVSSRTSAESPDFDIEVVNADGTGRHVVTDTPVDERYPVFSPTADRIAFIRRSGGTDLYVMNADGTGEQKLTEIGDINGPIDWSPDGASLVFSMENDFGQQIAQYTLATDTVAPLTPVEEAEDLSPSYSPSGTQVAYVRVPGIVGEPNARIIDVDGTDDHTLASVQPTVTELTWAPDGSGLLVQEGADDPKSVLADADGTGRTVISNEYAQGSAWQPCSGGTCEVSTPRSTITEVRLADRDGRELTVEVEVSPIRQGDVVLVTLFRKVDEPKFKEFGSLPTTVNARGLARATFTVQRKGQCKAVARYLGSDDYLQSKDKGKFSCRGGLAD